eukprot:4243272-Prymnesium_polylepis.1
MSNSDTKTEQQKHEEKIKDMDSMCAMAKGKQSRPTLDSLGVSGSIAFLRSTQAPTPRSSRR